MYRRPRPSEARRALEAEVEALLPAEVRDARPRRERRRLALLWLWAAFMVAAAGALHL